MKLQPSLTSKQIWNPKKFDSSFFEFSLIVLDLQKINNTKIKQSLIIHITNNAHRLNHTHDL